MSKTHIPTLAIVPGSFDPITYGHIDLVKRALKQYDKVCLAVMINSAKQYMFTIEERRQIAAAALEGIPNVEVISSEGMLWKLAEDLGATGIVKGYRNDRDLAYEREMANYNLAHNPHAPTVLLQAPKELAHVSSTDVRARIKSHAPLHEYLPPSAERLVYEIWQKKQ